LSCSRLRGWCGKRGKIRGFPRGWKEIYTGKRLEKKGFWKRRKKFSTSYAQIVDNLLKGCGESRGVKGVKAGDVLP